MALGMDQPFLLHQNFDDFDDFCVNARNWDLEYRQIEPGPFSGELLIGLALNWWTPKNRRVDLPRSGGHPPD